MNSAIVVLVSCGRRKSCVPCAAEDMYNSERFTLSKKLAIEIGHEWFIISAKYGLLPPSQIISPYDVCLSTFSLQEKETWARNITSDLKRYEHSTTFVILATSEYSTLLVSELEKLGYSVVAPFSNMTELEMTEYLKGISLSQIGQVKALYSEINMLAQKTGGIHLFKDCNGKMPWPQKGVYFIFDFNEHCLITGGTPKIVRIGTHAVSRGAKSTLWGRLKTHKGTINGNGSHRSSVFRLHIGSALINRDGLHCDTWGKGQNASKTIREQEAYLETIVSEYIGNLGVVVIAVEDEASPTSDRSFLERNAISLLSTANHSFDFASTKWLGYHSVKPAIQSSSLWNIDYINATFQNDFLPKLSQYVEQTIHWYK